MGSYASAHLVLLIVISVYWASNRVTNKLVNGPEIRKKCRFLCYRSTLFSSLVLSIFYLVLCVLKYFCWHANGWSDGDVAKTGNRGAALAEKMNNTDRAD
ncbi:hypothetical protein Syun_008126 [Stephania yunnanensis]|uniref:Uncharacterized protein n=1 Tax=Stephania yunnanensis TaxID=152371 RepID=A0AAP0PZX8_9MAGN